MVSRTLSLKEIILKDKLIDAQTLSNIEIRARQLGKDLEQVLIETSKIPRAQLIKSLSTGWNVKHVDLSNIDIDEDSARLVPEPTARRYHVLPFSKAENVLMVAMAKPWDLNAIEDLHLRTNYQIKPFLALTDDLSLNLDKVFNRDSKITDYISSMTDGSEVKVEEEKNREEISFESNGDDEKQARTITNGIILECISKGASDLHIEPFEKFMQVRYRIDGNLFKASFDVSRSLLNAIMARIKIMSGSMDITEKRLPQDGRIQITVQGRPVEFRVNTIPTAYGESCVMRILDRDSVRVELQILGFLDDTYQKLTEVIKKPYGIILVCGPTGSGKSTTLYSALNYLLKESKKLPSGEVLPVSPKKILTAEDPVEYDLDEVVQLPVNADIGLTFSSALRAFLRQDPDVIMVGEIRDKETAQISMEAALTGHLVFSTIHTNDAPTAVSRLSEMHIPTYLISSAVEGVLAQKLIRTLCKNCKKEMEEIPPKLEEEFRRLDLDLDDVKVMKAVGCKECNDSGYKGRTGIHELLVFDEDIRELLRTEIGAGPIRKLAVEKGMRLLWDDGLIKISKGITTYEELLRVSQ